MARKRDEFSIARLASAMQSDREVLRHYREERVKAVRQGAGAHWADTKSGDEMPCNYLGVYTQVMVRQLVGKNPRVMYSSFQRGIGPALAVMEDWANHEIERQNLADTFQRAALDALYSIGIVKVSLATPADAARAGWGLRAGEPYAQLVDLDDWCCDTHARTLDEFAYEGHRIRVPLAAVRDSTLYRKEARDLLYPSDDDGLNAEGDERVRSLGQNNYDAGNELEEMVDLWQVYVPGRKLVLTLPCTKLGGPSGERREVLRETEWLGPDAGPFHHLGYGTVPGNFFPKAPVMDLVYLNDQLNKLLWKMLDQGVNQKTVGAVSGSGDADGNRILKAPDRALLALDDPKSYQEIRCGGVDVATFQFWSQIKETWSQLAGNLSLLAGMSPQSKTASQDKLLNENATAAVADMQAATTVFVSKVLRALGWYWWTHPQKVMQSEYKIPGLPEMSAVRELYPDREEFRSAGKQTRKGRFESLDAKVDPYSLSFDTPMGKAAKLKATFKEMVMPIYGLLQQQGRQVDLGKLLDKISRYEGQDDWQDILSLTEPPEEQAASKARGGAGMRGGGMPQETTRNYERQSVPQEGGEEAEAVQAMMDAEPSRNGQGGY